MGRPKGWRKPEAEKMKQFYMSLHPIVYTKLLEACESLKMKKTNVISELVEFYIDDYLNRKETRCEKTS